MSCPIILSLSWRLVIFQFFRFFWRPSVCRNPTPTKHSSLGCLDMHRFQKRAAPGDQPMPRISFQNVHGPRCEPWCWYIKTYKTDQNWVILDVWANVGKYSSTMEHMGRFLLFVNVCSIFSCFHGSNLFSACLQMLTWLFLKRPLYWGIFPQSAWVKD